MISLAATIEVPTSGSSVGGVGYVSGWKCPNSSISISFDGEAPNPAAALQPRNDTASACRNDGRNGYHPASGTGTSSATVTTSSQRSPGRHRVRPRHRARDDALGRTSCAARRAIRVAQLSGAGAERRASSGLNLAKYLQIIDRTGSVTPTPTPTPPIRPTPQPTSSPTPSPSGPTSNAHRHLGRRLRFNRTMAAARNSTATGWREVPVWFRRGLATINVFVAGDFEPDPAFEVRLLRGGTLRMDVFRGAFDHRGGTPRSPLLLG